MPTGFDIPEPPVVAANATVVPHDGNATLTIADAGKVHTNTGVIPTETITLTLPAAASFAGESIKVQLTAAEIVRATPATGEKIFLGGSGVASKYLNIAAVIGNYADIHCNGVDWLVLDYSGVLTKEA